MADQGYFVVDRGIWDHRLFKNKPFDECRAWLWMISSAAWEDTTVRIHNTTIDLKRGELAFSTRFLAHKFRWSEARVRRFLKLLKTEKMTDAVATQQSTHLATQLSICNYNEYQLDGRSERRSDVSKTDAKKKKKETKKEKQEPENYVFEDGVIRLNGRDFEQWNLAFHNLDLRAELLGLSDWASQQRNWFVAVKAALAKKNRQAKIDIAQAGRATAFQWASGIEGVI